MMISVVEILTIAIIGMMILMMIEMMLLLLLLMLLIMMMADIGRMTATHYK